MGTATDIVIALDILMKLIDFFNKQGIQITPETLADHIAKEESEVDQVNKDIGVE